MSSPKAFLKDQSSNFDKLSFAKYMKDIGRAYRKQAMELVSICRTFVQVGERSISQDAHLRRVLEVVDDALSSAADPKNKTSGTDKKFEGAINALSDYEQRYHQNQRDVSNGPQGVSNGQHDVTKGQQGALNGKGDVTKGLPVAERMKSARENDKKSSSNLLNRLKQSFKTKLVEGPTKVARFLLPGSLPDKSPKVVEQMLGKETRLEEILWNFSRLKDNQRITLKQNPRFYEGLPRSAREYSVDFTNEPIESFWDATEIWVLTDERSRVFLETDKGKRAFGNFWVPDEAIIFKDIGGRLEGEGIVAADIRSTPNLWHREEPAVISPTMSRPTTGPANPSDLPPINTNPLSGRMFEDWRELVRDTLNSPNISICISTKGTPPESPDKWVLSSPISPTPGSPAQPFSIMRAESTDASEGATAPPQLTLRIPVSYSGPLTALSYKTARSTYSPVSQTPFAPPSTLYPWESSAAAPPSPAKPTPISQDPPVAVTLMSLTVATFTHLQARSPPSVIAQRPEPPPQQAGSTGTALISSTRSSVLHAGDSHVGNPISVPVPVPATSNGRAPSPGQQQGESAAAPVEGPAQIQEKKKNWFQKYIWDYGKGK
ncbi:hypothetical protein BJY52DRAFT_1216206 [Lactarius psammicola]|nr:hypothetical protein BJY52DRAFT_1216206 [Lactarius psammicola]